MCTSILRTIYKVIFSHFSFLFLLPYSLLPPIFSPVLYGYCYSDYHCGDVRESNNYYVHHNV